MKLLFSFVLVLCSFTSFAQSNSWQIVQDSIPKILAKEKIPAVQIAVFSTDSTLFYGTWGESESGSGKMATDSSVFRLGSTSKHFVSALALILSEKGMFSLDETLKNALPEFEFENKWEETHPITLRHLMEHTSGFDDIHFHEYAVNDSAITLKDGIQAARYTRAARWKPGTVSSYCNLGPPLVARAIEVKMGKRYEDLVQEYVFNPLKMHSTSFFVEDRFRSQMTSAHEGNPVRKTDYWHIAVRPSGSINTTALEMVKWGQTLLNDGSFSGNQILPEGAFQEMHTPTTALASQQDQFTGYALGMLKKFDGGYTIIEHGGATNGHQCQFLLIPEANVGIIAMINSDQGLGLINIVDLIKDNVLEEKDISESITPISQEQSELFSGYYYSRFARNGFSEGLGALLGRAQISQKGDSLMMKSLLGGEDSYIFAIDGIPHFGTKSSTYDIKMVETDWGMMIDPIKMVKITPFRYWGGYLWIAIAILSLVVSLFVAGFYVLIAIARWFKPKIKPFNTAWSFIPTLSALPFIILIFLISGKSFTDLVAISEIGLWTGLIFLLTALLPLFTVIHFFWVKEQYDFGRWKLAWLNAFGFISTASITFFALQYGFWAFKVWMDL